MEHPAPATVSTEGGSSTPLAARRSRVLYFVEGVAFWEAPNSHSHTALTEIISQVVTAATMPTSWKPAPPDPNFKNQPFGGWMFSPGLLFPFLTSSSTEFFHAFEGNFASRDTTMYQISHINSEEHSVPCQVLKSALRNTFPPSADSWGLQSSIVIRRSFHRASSAYQSLTVRS